MKHTQPQQWCEDSEMKQGSTAGVSALGLQEAGRGRYMTHSQDYAITWNQHHLCLSCSLDRLLTKVGVVPLVKEEFRPDSLHNNVPGVHGAGAAHQCGQDGVSGKHIALCFCQLREGRKRVK